MGTQYNYEIGFETLHPEFKKHQKRTPKGISLQNKRNSTIILKFKINGKPKSKGCNCTYTLDGMTEAVKKAYKVAEALKTITSETEFEEWYDKEILEVSRIEDDLLSFEQAIARVEDDFWGRRDRRKQKRIKGHPSHEKSWHDTYGRFYRYLPATKIINFKDINAVCDRWKKGTKTYGGCVSAMRKLARLNRKSSVLKQLEEIDSTQTEYREHTSIGLNDFLAWRDKVLGITVTLHPNCDLSTRKHWLWVFSMQVVYGLRIHEVFAIENLNKPYVTKDKVTIPALNDESNKDNLIVVGEKTITGTTTKTSYRLARPIIPPKYHDLIERLEIKTPLIPTNRPKSDSYDTIRKFFCNTATERLERWNCPTTETHALRHCLPQRVLRTREYNAL